MRWWEETHLTALQKKWYQRLKKSGFNDIEDTSSPREYLKTWDSTHFHKLYELRGHEPFHGQADYYNRAGHFLHEFAFKNKREKEIWRLHAEGIGMNRIASQLKMTSAGCKNSVHHIIRNLQRSMRIWDFAHE